MAKSIVAENLLKTYRKGEVRALDGLSLDVEEGTVLSILGPNGAGKTTTVRVLATLLQPDSGHATVAGIDVIKNPKAVREIIGLSGQYAAVDETLTGWDNLVMFGRLYHLTSAAAQARASELLEQFGLTESAKRPIKTYSGGMRRRLDLAAALIVRPKVLFLDEPTTGLDPRGRMDMWAVIESLVKDGVTLLLTTQYWKRPTNSQMTSSWSTTAKLLRAVRLTNSSNKWAANESRLSLMSPISRALAQSWIASVVRQHCSIQDYADFLRQYRTVVQR